MYNNDIAIENFINFCDEMMIANEGLSVNKIFTAITKGIKKLIGFIVSLPSKLIKYIKTKFSKLKDSKKYQEDVNDVKDLTKKLNKQENVLKDLQKEVENTAHNSDPSQLNNNIIDVSNKFKTVSTQTEAILNTSKVFEEIKKSNEETQKSFDKFEQSKNDTLNKMGARHEMFHEEMAKSLKNIYENLESIDFFFIVFDRF